LWRKISAVLAFHPGKRYVEKASQLLILNRLAKHTKSAPASIAMLAEVVAFTTAKDDDSLLDRPLRIWRADPWPVPHRRSQ